MAGQVTLAAVSGEWGGLVRPASSPLPADERTLPVLAPFVAPPSRGLRRGSTVAVGPRPARPAAAAPPRCCCALLAAAASKAGFLVRRGRPAGPRRGRRRRRRASSWTGWPSCRNPRPAVGHRRRARCSTAFDVVVAAPTGRGRRRPYASRLAARARQRGSVLVPYGREWEGADVTLRVTRSRRMWLGLGHGHGRLRRREVTIVAQGRGAAAQPKEITVWMPTTGTGPRGPVVPVVPVADAPRPRLALIQGDLG